MTHERLSGESNYSGLGTPTEMTPSQLDQRLNRIQRRLPLEAAATLVIGATSLPLLYLAMAEYYGDDPKFFAALLAFKVVCAAAIVGAMGGTVLTGGQTYADVKERSGILETAREKGLAVSGVIFKRLR